MSSLLVFNSLYVDWRSVSHVGIFDRLSELLLLKPYLWLAQEHTATAMPFIYSSSGNCAVSAPISTFMCLWAIYIFPGSVPIFPPAEQADPSWEYIYFAHRHMHVEIGTEAPIFLFWEYLFQIFGILSLQCSTEWFSHTNLSSIGI